MNSKLPPDEYLFDPTKDTDNHEYFCLTQRAQKMLVALALPPDEELFFNTNDHKLPVNFREYFFIARRGRRGRRGYIDFSPFGRRPKGCFARMGALDAILQEETS